MSMKKGFLLHHDSLGILDMLTDEQAGKLFKAIRAYHTGDSAPEMEDPLVKVALHPFIQQFVRDAEKYAETCAKRSRAGRKSAEAKANKRQQESTKSTSVKSVKQTSTKSTDSDSDSDTKSDSDNESGNKRKKRVASYTDDFESWWREYGKGSKLNAFKRWEEKRKSGDLPELEALIAVTQQYKTHCEVNERPLKDGEGWINGHFWESDWSVKSQQDDLPY